MSHIYIENVFIVFHYNTNICFFFILAWFPFNTKYVTSSLRGPSIEMIRPGDDIVKQRGIMGDVVFTTKPVWRDPDITKVWLFLDILMKNCYIFYLEWKIPCFWNLYPNHIYAL